jgi:hypothetical protein
MWNNISDALKICCDNFNMTTYRYNCKYRTLSIPLFDEDGKILYDCICICNNLDVGSLHIYDKLRFRTYITSFPICYDFTDTKCEEAVRSRMIYLMQKNPYISSSEIIKITGHSNSTIIRHYMTLRRKAEYDGVRV